MKKKQGNNHIDKIAIKKYVNSQVKTMRQYGAHVSNAKHKRILTSVTRALAPSPR